jgi:hypothetical protein
VGLKRWVLEVTEHRNGQYRTISWSRRKTLAGAEFYHFQATRTALDCAGGFTGLSRPERSRVRRLIRLKTQVFL